MTVSSDGESEAQQTVDRDPIVPNVTLLELIAIVSEYAESERELLATVVYMVNGGSVRGLQ